MIAKQYCIEHGRFEKIKAMEVKMNTITLTSVTLCRKILFLYEPQRLSDL